MISKKLIDLEKCKIIFFDLEFYVPPKNRKVGFSYNPVEIGNLILGGTFLSISPLIEQLESSSLFESNHKSFWIWNYSNEAELVNDIFNYLSQIKKTQFNEFQGKISPLFCGIGISHSDVPILFELFSKYSIISREEIFSMQNGFRTIDLSQVSIGVFNSNDYFLYPKTKKDLLQKYFNDSKLEDGKVVWKLYEDKEYSQIIDRVNKEVRMTIECYIKLKKNFENYKKIEAESKRKIEKK